MDAHRRTTRARGSRAWASWLAVASFSLVAAACGGGGGAGAPDPGPTPPPIVAKEFDVLSGGAACGASGCSADNAGGTGVGGADGADGGSAGAGVGESTVRNASITAYKPDGTVLGSAPLQAGLVSLYPGTYKGPFLLKLVDTGAGQYWDESTRSWTPLQGQTLHAMVPSLKHHVSVNPLSETAYRLALRRVGAEAALTAGAMQEANDAVLAQFNAKLPSTYRTNDVTNFATPLDESSGAGAIPNTWAGRYSAVLAGMPIAGTRFNPALPAPALSYGLHLVADVTDDGVLNASATPANPAYGASQAALLTTGICTSVATWGSAALPSTLSGSAAASASPGELTLLAGSLGGAGNCDGPGTSARFNQPNGVAIDGAGNVYVADTANDAIRKITPAGLVTTLASSSGTLVVSKPYGVAVDTAGNVYATNTARATVLRITPAGTVTELAGSAGNAGAADGTGAAARFNWPQGIAIDAAGNLYVTDTNNHTIRKVTSAGIVTTVAGLPGQVGSADDTRTAARFNRPEGIASDAAGNLTVADTYNHTIRRITVSGVVTTLAGLTGQPGSGDGTGAAARFRWPQGVAVDTAGNVDVVDTSNHTIRRITSAGVVSTIAGSPGNAGIADGAAAAARFNAPAGIGIDPSGTRYIADSENFAIRKMSAVGTTVTLAGSPGLSGSTDGTGGDARFYLPRGAATDAAGNAYVADTVNHTIRRISPSGVVTTYAGAPGQPGSADGVGPSARFNRPWAVAADAAGTLYVADSGNSTIRRIATGAQVVTLAGSAGQVGSVDGAASAARFDTPWGIAVDASGNVYVSDAIGTVRKIVPGGAVVTLAGAAGQTGAVDGAGPAARFHQPQGLATDAAGNVYVADTINATIRRITPTGLVSTFAGAAGSAGAVDGTGASARFDRPAALSMDAAGNLFVADSGNSTIRRITAAGVVTTAVGQAGSVGNLLGNLPASLGNPVGVAVRGTQLVIVVDNGVLLATPRPAGW